MCKYLLAALLAGTIVTPAFAQEAGPFSGFRVEGIAGYDRLGSGDQEDDDSIDGVAYGAGLGFDFDLGSVVAGIEAEYSDSTGKKTLTEDGETASLRTGRDLYVGGRLGFRAGPATLLYGRAGYTSLSLDGSLSDGTDKLNFKGKTDGWRLGAGVEQLFGPNAYGKIEYRYSNYGDFDYNASLAGLDFDDIETDLDLRRHQVVVGLGFRF
jgi:outer membrane immunogenic protein